MIGTHWIALYVNGNNGRGSSDTIFFESFGVEKIPKEIKKKTYETKISLQTFIEYKHKIQ